MKLTTQLARTIALPAGKTEFFARDDAVGGFAVRLRHGAKGVSRTWTYQYNIGRQDRRVTLGDAMTVTADDARRMAAKLQAEVRTGGDPSARKAKVRAAALETMGAILETYLPIKRANLRLKSYVQVERHFLTYYKGLLSQPLRQIDTATLSRAYERHASENGATTATNCLRSMHAFQGWALRQGLLDRNAAVGVERRKTKSRDRVLDDQEIKALWQCTEDESDYSSILRLLLLTACRANEIAELRWSEVFSDRIVLPAERVKNGHMHVIPLTPTMRAILDSRERRPGRDLVFGAREGRPFTGWSTAKAKLDRRMAAAGVTASWVVHDLRRSAATGMAGLGIAPATIEASLNHRSGFRAGVSGIYNRFDYETPVRLALEAWDRRVGEIVEGSEADKVIRLRA